MFKTQYSKIVRIRAIRGIRSSKFKVCKD